MVGFSCFLLCQAETNQFKKLSFCTREGVFFKAVFDTLFASRLSELQIETGLLEVSRLSVFGPSLSTNQDLEIDGLFRLYKKQSARTLISSLGLDPVAYEDLITIHGLSMDQLFERPIMGSRLGDFLNDQAFKDRILLYLTDQRAAALAYLRQSLGCFKRHGIVDIGWRGTVLNSIARLFPEKNFLGMYLGLAPERNEAQTNCQRIAYGPDSNRSSQDSDLLHAVDVLEFICLSNHGSAERYVIGDDGSATAIMSSKAQEAGISPAQR